MLTQNLQQTYATTTQSLFNAFTSKEYLEMSQESSIVSQYYSLAGGPKQYYIIIQTFDMLEYLFRLYKTKMIDVEQWLRWEATAKYLQFQSLKKHGTNKGEPFTRVCKFIDSLGANPTSYTRGRDINITQRIRS